MLLADMGATLLQVERPEGDAGLKASRSGRPVHLPALNQPELGLRPGGRYTPCIYPYEPPATGEGDIAIAIDNDSQFRPALSGARHP